MGETISIVLIILIILGAIPLFFYLRNRTINRWVGYLKEAKSVINGEWLKFGKILEGEYRGRKVQCGLYGDTISGGPVPFLRMKPNKSFNMDGLKPKNEWIDGNFFSLNFQRNLRSGLKRDFINFIFHPGEFSAICFFKKDYFVDELEKSSQLCEKVEAGEIKLK